MIETQNWDLKDGKEYGPKRCEGEGVDVENSEDGERKHMLNGTEGSRTLGDQVLTEQHFAAYARSSMVNLLPSCLDTISTALSIPTLACQSCPTSQPM